MPARPAVADVCDGGPFAERRRGLPNQSPNSQNHWFWSPVLQGAIVSHCWEPVLARQVPVCLFFSTPYGGVVGDAGQRPLLEVGGQVRLQAGHAVPVVGDVDVGGVVRVHLQDLRAGALRLVVGLDDQWCPSEYAQTVQVWAVVWLVGQMSDLLAVVELVLVQVDRGVGRVVEDVGRLDLRRRWRRLGVDAGGGGAALEVEAGGGGAALDVDAAGGGAADDGRGLRRRAAGRDAAGVGWMTITCRARSRRPVAGEACALVAKEGWMPNQRARMAAAAAAKNIRSL